LSLLQTLFYQIVHETIVDTSLVFPHARGRPFKRALKNLMSEHLHKIIQENGKNLIVLQRKQTDLYF